eukprot:scaffold8095_cov82-Skeletonema_dohrnii-CCMP3373.AAC.6
MKSDVCMIETSAYDHLGRHISSSHIHHPLSKGVPIVCPNHRPVATRLGRTICLCSAKSV